MRTTRAVTGTAVATLALAAGLALSPPSASAHDGHEPEPAGDLSPGQHRVIRTATERFTDLAVAEAEGYLFTPECAVDVEHGSGAMGYHFVNPGLMDGRVDLRRPEILLYVPTEDGLQLAGVEYFVADEDQDLTTDDDRPKLMGHAFDGPMPGHGGDMPVHYDLHAWVFIDNPSGDLAPWNPDVSCEVG